MAEDKGDDQDTDSKTKEKVAVGQLRLLLFPKLLRIMRQKKAKQDEKEKKMEERSSEIRIHVMEHSVCQRIIGRVRFNAKNSCE